MNKLSVLSILHQLFAEQFFYLNNKIYEFMYQVLYHTVKIMNYFYKKATLTLPID